MEKMSNNDRTNYILNEYDDQKQLYESFLKMMSSLIASLVENKQITINSIQSRLKDKDSLARKIDKKNKYSTLKDITDICGIRISTFYSDDVDRISEIIEKEFDIDTVNTIDKRKSLEPDRFGYLSLHYIVSVNGDRSHLSEYQQFSDLKFEIQIRSILQNVWAEIEHDLGYKSSDGIPSNIKRDFSRLAGLLELADKEFMSIRNFLNEYQKTVEDTLNSENKLDFAIDNVSLKTFYQSQNFKDHISMLSQRLNLPVDEYLVLDNMGPYFRAYEYLGIHTIAEVDKLLKDAFNFTINAFEPDKDPISKKSIADRGIVYYSMYFKLVQDNNDVKAANDIFEILGIGIISNENETTTEWFNRLKKCYKL